MSSSQPRRFWKWKLPALLAVLVACVAGFLWYRQYAIDRETAMLLAELDRNEPGWRKPSEAELYQRFPVSPGFIKCIEAFPVNYRGWFGDDILHQEEALDYQPDGRDYAVRMPEAYLKLLRERLYDPPMTKLRQAFAEFDAETGEFLPPGNTASGNLKHLRTLTNYLCDEILMAAHDHRWHDLLPLVKRQMHSSELYRRVPGPESRLIYFACHNHLLNTLNHALAQGTVPDDILHQWQKELEQHDSGDIAGMIRIMRSEDMQAFDPESSETLKDHFSHYYFVTKHQSLHDNAEAKRLRMEAADYLQQNKNVARLELLKLHKQALEMSPDASRPIYDLYIQALQNTTNQLTQCFVSMWHKLVAAQMFNTVMHDMAIVGIACERFRLENGKWPDSLNDLVPRYVKKIPSDPFSGKPILYKTLPDGVVIYSIGRDGIDDGGNVLLQLETNSMPDKGYRLFNPELRGRKFEEKAHGK